MDTESSTSTKRTLPRNQACYPCRHRKMRCDGQRPVCGQCRRSAREEDCEYTDNYSRARAEVLEEDISRIQFRIHQLEHPQEAKTDVMLLDPYKQVTHFRMPGLHQVLDASTSSAMLLHPPSRVPTPDAWWTAEELPPHLAKNLLDTFMTSAASFGFFLDPEQVYNASMLSVPINHHSRPTPALTSAIYLAAISISPSPSLKMHEAVFRTRALSSVSNALAGLHPKRVLHALQAEVILAWYFYGVGKLLEGLYHTATAVSLGVTSDIYSMRNGHVRPGAMLLADSDADGEEHVNACWEIVVLDRAWSVVMNTLPNWTNPIETPWPGTKVSEMTDIVQTFLAVGDHQPPKSSKELLAKAAVLWEAANHLVTRSEWKPGSPHNAEAAQAFYDQFSAIDKRIEEVCSPESPSGQSEPSPTDQQIDLVGRSMAHAAEIQLHRPFAQDSSLTQAHSQQRFLDAARAILHLARTHPAIVGSPQTFISPILAPIWAIACRVILHELQQNPTDHELRWEFDSSFAAMRVYMSNSLFMQYHLQKIQDEYDVASSA
ncbi:hypothetical protein MIND_00551600 [Mycena indigotica]|uniref:Zn(2)-C6 fungal-type domain-containing protein n=1 Tax=Mycena indigotica TaxID=2126181 RepID=A0A8H6SYD6_9AGAR|nr:uncharacterized protein MIND_00551600 [Mycena indigotica]KAF7307568.1 hypothetical protein MIND_00551600 [Mycena indigotica]